MNSELVHGLGISVIGRMPTLKKMGVGFVQVNGLDVSKITRVDIGHISERIQTNKLTEYILATLPGVSELTLDKDCKVDIEAPADVLTVTFIKVAQSCTASITEKSKGGTHLIIVEAGENSRINYVSTQENSENTVLMRDIHFVLNKKAQAKLVDIELGHGMTIQRHHSVLKGANSGVEITNLFLASKNKTGSSKYFITHDAESTNSLLTFSGAATGTAKYICHGRIHMNANAHNAQGVLNEHTLLLSDKAEISTLPQLEVHVPDVSCHHSASTGGIDNEKLFYLQSRGIQQKEATKLILEGFFNSALKELDETIKTKVITEIGEIA
ncbi:MAG: SufD family Fe-S cluster assembly protein [Candidatus Woesearchaeota archaeon]